MGMEKQKKSRSIEDIFKESLPNESLFATANKKYDPEEEEE